MTTRAPKLFSIPPGAPFLDTLADALIDGVLVGDIGWGAAPLSVADVTVYLPTRRAARAFAGVLASRANGPAILPRIVPLGDADETESSLLGDGDAIAGDPMQPAATGAERLIFLADLVMRWRKQLELAITPLARDEHGLIAESPAEVFALAGDLARVLDMLTIEGVTLDQLSAEVPGEHDRYWEISRKFLGIAFDAWPRWLATRGLADPIARNESVLRARAKLLATGRDNSPVVAAGSTGTHPATAELLGAIARRPRGAVVLPGLDLIASDKSFAAILGEEPPHHGHPQAVLARLLMRLQAARADVREIGVVPKILAARERILSEAMQPPSQTGGWAQAHRDAEVRRDVDAALRGAVLIESANDREEATAIALAMRRETRRPGRTAALVTPDRALAERVGAALARWGLDVDDSAGRRLSRSPRGALALLAAEWLATPADGAKLAALLAHPRANCGLMRADMTRAAAAIEIGLLRGYPPTSSLESLNDLFGKRRALASEWAATRPARRLSEEDWTHGKTALDALVSIVKTYAATGRRNECACLGEWTEALRAALAALTQTPDDKNWLAEEIDGAALAELFDELAAAGRERAPLTRFDYPLALKRLLDSVNLSPPTRTHPRLAIWGLLEARLLSADLVILGGLNEASWPPQPTGDAFLNRALRGALKLPQAERRIGQTAHDFTAAFGGATRAILTRAAKSNGAPAVASRFWRRLEAYAGPGGNNEDGVRVSAWTRALKRGDIYLHWARALDEPAAQTPIERPAPIPPAALAPRRLSVSRIETLVRDPYAIYARSILKLDPLPPIGVTADYALRGTIIHDAVSQFSDKHDPRAPDAVETLIKIAEKLFDDAAVDPELLMFWRPGFRRAARAFVAWEVARGAAIAKLDVECEGEIALKLGDGSDFLLTARADRIERLRDGTLAIVDFKTGAPPSRKEVLLGLSPQLTLEAAMARRGAFDRAHRGHVASQLVYVRLSGAKSGKFEDDLAIPSRNVVVDPVAIPEKHLEQLQRLMTALFAGQRGFASRPLPQYARDVGDYDHLARVAEWMRGRDDE